VVAHCLSRLLQVWLRLLKRFGLNITVGKKEARHLVKGLSPKPASILEGPVTKMVCPYTDRQRVRQVAHGLARLLEVRLRLLAGFGSGLYTYQQGKSEVRK
jgi:hypothetical protein